MQARQKLFFAGIGGIFVLSLQFASGVVTSAEADHHVESTPVKYVMTVDYPVGGKADYIAWVTSVAADLQAPPELQRIASYDNYHGASPHRVIEMEFDSMADAAAYLENPAVRAVFDDLPNHGVNSSLNVFVKRSDYSKN
ncbi:MAG: hypothetical protein VCF24_26510 [Candidatus Latescibacterota bacterium]|jgi:hypothetical protein